VKLKLGLLCLLLMIPALIASAPNSGDRYLSPSEMAISHDGRTLFVLCEKGDELLVVDTQSKEVIRRVQVGHVPRGLALSADGRWIYVAN